MALNATYPANKGVVHTNDGGQYGTGQVVSYVEVTAAAGAPTNTTPTLPTSAHRFFAPTRVFYTDGSPSHDVAVANTGSEIQYNKKHYRLVG